MRCNASKSDLVKAINQKVNYIKNDKTMEVEYMTLLERYREKFQEGIEQGKIEVAKALLDILDDKTISTKIGLSLDKVKSLRK